MKAGESYVPYEDIRTKSGETLQRGKTYLACSRDSLVDTETGEVHVLKALQANRSEWYLQPKCFNPPVRPTVTIKDLVFEGVRAYPDMDRQELHALLHESCPRKAFTLDTLSGLLSEDHRIQMVDRDGNVVTELGHNERCCTFSLKQRNKAA